MLCWKGIISEITWRETARRQSWSSEQPTELHYKFEKNCRLECQTTVFTCVHSGCLRKSFAKCKRMGQRMSGMYWVSTQIWAKWVAPQRKTVSMKFLHYLTIPLTKPAVISWQCNVKQWAYKRQRALPTPAWKVPRGKNSHPSTWEVLCESKKNNTKINTYGSAVEADVSWMLMEQWSLQLLLIM